MFIDVGQKLAADHAAGMIHEEIRIENVFVLPDGHGEARGLKPALQNIAKVGPGSVRNAPVSLEQRLAEMKSTESVAFLAPEQFRGRAADARANQFSFCVALYRALYRQPPFDHDWAVSQAGESRRTPLGSIHFDLLVQSFDRAALINLAREVLSGNLRPPPEETDVPVWLDLILRRALQTDPDERYPSMRPLLADITKQFQAGAPGQVPGLVPALGHVHRGGGGGGAADAGRRLDRPHAIARTARGGTVIRPGSRRRQSGIRACPCRSSA